MVIKDERTSIARVSNEWKSDASMHTPTPTPTHSFALDRCYSYYMCYNFVFYFHRDNRVRKRDNSNIIKQRYEALRERQNAYASFSWAAFKFYECLPRSLEASKCNRWSSKPDRLQVLKSAAIRRLNYRRSLRTQISEIFQPSVPFFFSSIRTRCSRERKKERKKEKCAHFVASGDHIRQLFTLSVRSSAFDAP